MAKNMFYNYDVYADNRDRYNCQTKCCADKPNVDYLYSINGDLIGLTTKANANFTIYFNFHSEDNSELFALLINCPILLEILDTENNLMVTIPARMNKTYNECSVDIDLSVHKHIVKGKYRLYLYYIENNIKKLLYDKANLLSVK